MAKTIDTLKSAELLTKAGIAKSQAEAIVEVVSSTEDALVTKGDLELRLELLESRITNKLYAVGITLAALTIGTGVFF